MKKGIFILLAVLMGSLFIQSCTTTPTSTVVVKLGETTINEIENNTGYIWYKAAYDSYPDSINKLVFDSSVNSIKSNDSGQTHSIVMVIKPTCTCPYTKEYFPQVMKVIDAAGISRTNKVKIFVTDASLAGIDDVKQQYKFGAAPVFILLKNNIEVGRFGFDDFEKNNFSTIKAMTDLFMIK
ncbi:MAG: hypothetical protein IPP65_12570 [Chlorobi bacterium]|nr:hypothetical protein [Chlorobiota bacterium]